MEVGINEMNNECSDNGCSLQLILIHKGKKSFLSVDSISVSLLSVLQDRLEKKLPFLNAA